MTQDADIDQLAINTIRGLVIDAIEQSQSGHPGTPMGAAPTAYALWQRILRYDPAEPGWLNRDRFVLSNGHASMLLYSLIHLAGVRASEPSYEPGRRDAVTLDDIRTFRQGDSRCPGHPEHGWTSGVETTTGPLGQGVATSVGMAIAGNWLGATYNRPGFTLFDFNVYALCGDGDMMEGIASEAASLAGHLRLSNLCWIYDSNRVTIEGHTDLAFSEDVAARFLAYGWNVARVTDPNDIDVLERAFRAFATAADRPTLIIVHSHIGYGSPHKHDSADGARRTARPRGGAPDQAIPRLGPRSGFRGAGVRCRAHFAAGLGARGAARSRAWRALFAGLPSAARGSRRPDRADGPPRPAGRMGGDAAGLPARRQGHGDARRLGPRC